eukprot:3458456-Pyramimonas_sp.AAC.1
MPRGVASIREVGSAQRKGPQWRPLGASWGPLCGLGGHLERLGCLGELLVASRCRMRPDVDAETGGIGKVGIGMQLARVSQAFTAFPQLGN